MRTGSVRCQRFRLLLFDDFNEIGWLTRSLILPSRHSDEGRNPRFALAMDSGLRRNDGEAISSSCQR